MRSARSVAPLLLRSRESGSEQTQPRRVKATVVGTRIVWAVPGGVDCSECLALWPGCTTSGSVGAEARAA